MKQISLIKKNYISILFIVVIFIASFFRLWKLGDIPFGMNNDSAWEASAALDIINGGDLTNYIPYATEGWRGEGIVRGIVAILILIIGNNPIVIPLSTVFFGIGLVIASLFLFKNLFDEKIALLSSFFIAVSGWHITFSKTGWRAVTVPFFTTLIFYFLFKGFESKKIIHFMLSGVFLGFVTFYTYDGARAVPIFFIIWIFIEVISRKRKITAYIKQISILFISAFIISIPMIYYSINNFENFTSRSEYLFIGHVIEEQKSIIPLFENIKLSLFTFNFNANGNDFFIREPLMDNPLSFLFPIGIIVSLYFVIFKKSKNYLFMLIWFSTALIPGILSAPNGNRLIGAIPSVYFFAAIGLLLPLTWFAKKLKNLNKNLYTIPFILILIFCSYSALNSYSDYLGKDRRELMGFYPETKITTNYIKSIWDTHDVYLTDNYPRELLTYYLYRPGFNPFFKNYTWLEYNNEFLEIKKNKNRGIAFFMFANPENELIANQLLQKYKNSNKFYIWYENDNIYRPASLVIQVKP